MSRSPKPVLVLGAGLAGLSAALHLEPGRPVTLLEREDRVGGLTRSFKVDGFTFDLTGHLLHLRRPEVRELVKRILPDGMAFIQRRSYIHSHGVYTDYPFQANLHGLPAEVVQECLVGFVEALMQAPGHQAGALASGSFRDWVLATFGAGIARHFMFPYNRKLWCLDPEEITAEWVSWAVPRPQLAEVVGGALGRTNEGMGYNPSFQYPVAGGIEVLPNALAAQLRSTTVHLESTVTAIDLDRRVVETDRGQRFPFDEMVSTLPLPALLRLVARAPETVRQAARGLRATKVLNVNLGIARPDVTHRHWTYFPEDKYVFYRVGSPTAFCAASAPAGCSSLYVEVARPQLPPDQIPALKARIRADLVACGLLRPDDRIVAEQVMILDPAYVIFDRHRNQHLPALLEWLESHGVHSIGRFGRWEYGSMESAMAQGMEVAARLTGLTVTDDPSANPCPPRPAPASSTS